MKRTAAAVMVLALLTGCTAIKKELDGLPALLGVLESQPGKELTAAQRKALLDLALQSREPIRLHVSGRTKAPSWITLKYPVSDPDPVENAKRFVEDFGQAFRRSDMQEFAQIGGAVESDCCFRVSFAQKYRDINVFGGGIDVVQDRRGWIRQVHGLMIPGLSLATTPTLTEIQAKEKIRSSFVAEEFAGVTGKLAVFHSGIAGPGPGKAHLAWHFAYPSDHENHLDNWFVDATTGALISEVRTRPQLADNHLALADLSIDRTVPMYHVNPETGAPDYVSWHLQGGLPIAKPGHTPADAVVDFLESRPRLFGDAAPRKHQEFTRTTALDGLGFTVLRTRQKYGGLPVFGVGLTYFLAPGNRLWVISGNYVAKMVVDLSVATDPEAAKTHAATLRAEARCAGCDDAALAAATDRWRTRIADDPELGIFPKLLPSLPPKSTRGPSLMVQPPEGGVTIHRPTRGVLSYRVVFPDSVFWVDAVTGQHLYSYSTIKAHGGHGDVEVYDANGASKEDFAGFTGINVDEAASGSTNADVQTARRAAHETLNFWYLRPDLFPYVFLDNVMDNGGDDAHLVANAVKTDDAGVSQCGNAWHIPGAFFGGPDHMVFCAGWVLEDVVAHEMTHGVTEHSSGLIYADESGALNEHYSDLFGEVIFPDAAGTWIVGPGIINRDMQSPTVNHMSNYQYPAANCVGNYDNPGLGCDNGGVHTNSGIPNLAATYMADGVPALAPATGTSPGMGREKVAALAFKTNTLYLDEWSGMKDAMLGTVNSCTLWLEWGWSDKLTPPLSQEDCDQILNAFNRVGVSATTQSGWYHTTGLFGSSEDFTRDDGLYVAGCTVRGYIFKLQNVDDPGIRRVCSNATICTPVGNTIDYSNGEFWARVNSWGPAGQPRKRVSIHVGRSNFEDIAVDIEWVPNVPAGLTQAHCEGDVISRKSHPIKRHWSNWGLGGKDDEWVGDTTPMPTGCVVTGVTLEKVEADGGRIGSIGREVGTNNSGARIVSDPVGTNGRRVKVHWWFNSFNIIRYRVIYTVAQPAGTNCWPA
jgi:thermolysin